MAAHCKGDYISLVVDWMYFWYRLIFIELNEFNVCYHQFVLCKQKAWWPLIRFIFLKMKKLKIPSEIYSPLIPPYVGVYYVWVYVQKSILEAKKKGSQGCHFENCCNFGLIVQGGLQNGGNTRFWLFILRGRPTFNLNNGTEIFVKL